jgi:hypothetical protein
MRPLGEPWMHGGEKVYPRHDVPAAIHRDTLDAAAVEARMTFQPVEQFPALSLPDAEHFAVDDLPGAGLVEQVGQAVGNQRILDQRARFAEKFAARSRHDVVIVQAAFERAIDEDERRLISRRWRVPHPGETAQ